MAKAKGGISKRGESREKTEKAKKRKNSRSEEDS